MKSSNRLLTIFGIVIGIMILIAIILVMALPGNGSVSLLPEDTPEGTVQRFFIALQNEDYIKAYTFITPPTTDKIPYDAWRSSYYRSSEKSVWKATIGKSKITGEEATVEVIIDVFRPQGPFSEPVHTNRMNFSLRRDGSGWTIISPVDLWWLY
ncbi:MAG TPA: hypothetical protein DCX22_01255 [Dehalococcoidia bacterium]|nr:hypothetical protein [Dehalococcoidia bacterium]